MSRTATTDLMRTLAGAARLAQRAPSVFNTQPWSWRVGSHTLDLLRDPARRLSVTDADSRQLTISCGAALHHARIALGAAGRRTAVTRFPDPEQPDLLARIEVGGRVEPTRTFGGCAAPSLSAEPTAAPSPPPRSPTPP
jgi:nitroreductase